MSSDLMMASGFSTRSVEVWRVREDYKNLVKEVLQDELGEVSVGSAGTFVDDKAVGDLRGGQCETSVLFKFVN